MTCNKNDVNTLIQQVQQIRKKRGRKSKKELEILNKYNTIYKETNEIVSSNNIPKKRGRKPKGGKIIEVLADAENKNIISKKNIILHLKYKTSNIENNSLFLSNMEYNPNIEQIQPYNESFNNDMKKQYYNIEIETESNYHAYDNKQSNDVIKKENNFDNVSSIKEIWSKLKDLQQRLHHNNLNDKKSSCFWCTCSFDNPPIYIPKSEVNNMYEVYGCFCTPECAAAYLCNEHIDSSTIWERYALLNSIYNKIYKYENNIKQAPSPYYLLDKYYGTLTIEEYRKLLSTDKMLIMVDKPLTRILPELCEENNETLLKHTMKKQNDYKLKRNKPVTNKIHTDKKSWLF